jgi:glycine/D-amino acid oxidase-like deaminating enzyme
MLECAETGSNHMFRAARDAAFPPQPAGYWPTTLGVRPRYARIEGDLSVDVAIIGGGYTGLSTAYFLKRAQPALGVAVLEAEHIGYGASGRNAGFVMTLFGASVPLVKALHGARRLKEAHEFMERAIDGLEATVREHDIACDFTRNGFLKVATSPAYERRIRDEVDTMQAAGVSGITWIDRHELAKRIDAPAYRGAWWEPACGSLNPLKWVTGLAKLIDRLGARIFEEARVAKVRRVGGRFAIALSSGLTVTARKVVYATNGYSHLLPGLRLKQMPAFTYVIVTERLSGEQIARLGWAGREGVEDGRNFMHYYRLTPDDRLIVGGGPGVLPFGRRMDYDASPQAWAHLEDFIGKTFPQLGPVRVAHRWGGAFSMTADFTPAIGTLRGGDAVYSVGCTGHGVAMTHTNGAILADLVREQRTALTDMWFVDRWAMPMPPEPVRSAVTQSVAQIMKLDDWWCERPHRDDAAR